MNTYIKARDILATTGDEDVAWAIARQDEGLLPSCTKADWLAMAYRGIEMDASCQRAYDRLSA